MVVVAAAAVVVGDELVNHCLLGLVWAQASPGLSAPVSLALLGAADYK